MMPHEERAMGDVIQFPDRDDTEHTDSGQGTVVRAVAERIDPDEAPDQPAVEPSTEVAQRGPVIPPALVGKAKQAGKAALPVGTQAAQFTARHAYFLLGGVWDTTAGVYSRWTGRDIEQRIAAAQAAGDHGVVAQLSAQRNESRKLFLERIKVFGGLLMQTPKFLAASGGLFLAVTFIVSVIAWVQPGGMGFTDVWSGLFAAIAAGFDWAVWAASWAPWAGVAALAGVLVKGYNARRRSGRAPAWAQNGTVGPQDAVRIDETAVAQALQHLGVKALRDYLKDANPLTYTVLPHRERGDVGVSAEVRLPKGCTAADVVERKKLLAGNLGRAAVEVWPSTGTDEALLKLWVADHGSLDKGAGAWPWIGRDEAVDAYQGIPVGTTLSGQQIIAPVDGASYLVGGRPGQGKSTFTLLMVLGACQDPAAEIWVYVLADNADFDPITDRLARYHVGAGQGVIDAALQGLKDVMGEIERRGQIMREKGARTAAEAGLPPLVVAFDEIHRLFQHRDKKIRDAAAAVAEDAARLARKYGILTIYATQSADATSIPKGVTRAVLQRVAFSVIDQPANDALLGTSAHRTGIRATELRPGTESYPGDRGKAVTVGLVPDADWAMCVGYYVTPPEAAQIGTRSLELLTEHGASVQRDDTAVERDLLADVAEVLGREDKVKATDVAARLRKLAPAYLPYQDLTADGLRELLDPLGVKVTKAGVLMVYTERVRQALAEREGGDEAD